MMVLRTLRQREKQKQKLKGGVRMEFTKKELETIGDAINFYMDDAPDSAGGDEDRGICCGILRKISGVK